MKKFTITFSLILFLITILGCQQNNSGQTETKKASAASQPTASAPTSSAAKFKGKTAKTVLGGDRDITLIIDPVPKRIIGAELIRLLSQPCFPSQEEEVFRMRVPSLEKFHISKVWHNTVIVTQLDAPATASIEAHPFLEQTQLDQARQDGIALFHQEGVWVYGQDVFFIVARDSASLAENGLDLGQKIVDIILGKINLKVSRELYADGLDPDIMAKLDTNYDWRMDVPRFYSLHKESAEDRVMMFRFRNRDPLIDRIITVHWGPAGSKPMTAKRVRQLRDDIMLDYSAGDLVSDNFLDAATVTFAGHDAVRLDGNWDNDKDLIGGPFRTYGFVDKTTDTYYIVDYFLLAIAMKKEPKMRQLNVIVNTFLLDK